MSVMKMLLVLGSVLMLSGSSLAGVLDGKRVFNGEGRYHDSVMGRYIYTAQLEIVSAPDGSERLVLRDVIDDGSSSILLCLLLQPSKVNHRLYGFKVLAPRSTGTCEGGSAEFTLVGWGHRGGSGIGSGRETLLNIGKHKGWSRTSIYLIEDNGKMSAKVASVGEDNSKVSIWFLTLEEVLR